MPELPEVETMVRGLRPALEGQDLRALQILDPAMLEHCTPEQIQAAARGARIASVTRRGKWVVLDLEPHRGCIVLQPRMTGGFWLVPPPRPNHIRAIFEVRRRREPVWFCDTRRLGRIAWHPTSQHAEAAFARSHGPDALQITHDDLRARLARTARPIKPALMDQKLVAGIGNIYADEILFHARIHPETNASALPPRATQRLHAAITAILQKAIDAEGSSFDQSYRTVLGLEGGFLAQNAMYGRAGQPCPACARPITKTKIKGLLGRPTHYCPHCQPRPRPSRARGRSGPPRHDTLD